MVGMQILGHHTHAQHDLSMACMKEARPECSKEPRLYWGRLSLSLTMFHLAGVDMLTPMHWVPLSHSVGKIQRAPLEGMLSGCALWVNMYIIYVQYLRCFETFAGICPLQDKFFPWIQFPWSWCFCAAHQEMNSYNTVINGLCGISSEESSP